MRNKSTIALAASLVFLGTASLAFAKTDKEFLSDAIQGNLGEISIGELVQKNGKSEGVRSFGKMLVQDHSAANDKAMTLAKAHDLPRPLNPKLKRRKFTTSLRNCSVTTSTRNSLRQWSRTTPRTLRNSRNRPRAATT